MKFLVTYSVIDGEFGNPLWHTWLMLSELEEGKKIKVVDTWGFYGMPITIDDDNRLVGIVKKKFNVNYDVDLQKNHGWVKHEEVRYLDVGTALHGTTFELTEEKFRELQARCNNMAKGQQDVVDEYAKLNVDIKPAEQIRNYAQEKYGRAIYEYEKHKAQIENRESRLKPFNVELSIPDRRPSFRNFYNIQTQLLAILDVSLKGSNNCKTQALELLKGILSDEQIKRLTVQGKHPFIPKFSGPLERICLHSDGPLRTHTKSSGEVVHYRDFGDKETQLHWTLPPQFIDTPDPQTVNSVRVSAEYSESARKVVQQLQRLEWLFINAVLPDKYKEYKDGLVKLIRDHYEAFAKLTMPKAKTTLNTLENFAFRLFSMPREKDEAQLLECIRKGEELINGLYFAAVNDCQIDDNFPCHMPAPYVFEGKPRVTYNSYFISPPPMPAEESQEVLTDNPNSLESVAAYLSEKDKNTLCKLIKRPRVEMDYDDEVSMETDRLAAPIKRLARF